jgi:hypothetical protein
MRSRGIVLPGNGSPVNGSMIVTERPAVFNDCEKFPARSSAVGTTVDWVMALWSDVP